MKQDTYPDCPAERYASVPTGPDAEETKLEVASLIRSQRRSLARLRNVRLSVYALAAVGWIVLVGNRVWTAVTKPGR